jgi:hypothetical protein
MERGTNILKSAGIDLSVFSRNLRKLDRTRMMARSMQRVVNRQKSSALKSILSVNIRKFRAFENVHNRVRGRLLLTYNHLFKDNKTPQQYFYNWYLRSNPQILEKLAWHLIIKQKLSPSIAASRLSYLAKSKTSRNKRLNQVRLMEGLCWLTNFIEMKNFLCKKNGFDRLNPMNHNGKYFLLQRVWNKYQKTRKDNLKKSLKVLKNMMSRSKGLLALLMKKNKLKKSDAFRNLRGFNRQEQSKGTQIQQNLKSQRGDLLLQKYLLLWSRSQASTALNNLRGHKQRKETKEAKEGRVQKTIWGMLKTKSRGKLGNAFDKLKNLNARKNERTEEERKMGTVLWSKSKGLTDFVKRKALQKLRRNNFLNKIKEKNFMLLGKGMKGKLRDSLRRLVKMGKSVGNKKQQAERRTNELIKKLVGRTKNQNFHAFYVLRNFTKIQGLNNNKNNGIYILNS